MIHINSRCPADHPCPLIRKCTAGAISQKGVGAPIINHEICIECGVCVDECPMGAVETRSTYPVSN